MPFFDDANNIWQPLSILPQDISTSLRRQLLDSSSVTARLKDEFKGDFHVEVLRHEWLSPTSSELDFLGLLDSQASIREVLLIAGGKPRVFARSVLPASSLEGANAALLKLGNKSLGEFLFTRPAVCRKLMEVTNIPARHLNHWLPFNYCKERAWGRRSLFHLDDKKNPISVCEIFLPEVSHASSEE